MSGGTLRKQYKFTVTPEHLINSSLSDRAVRLWCRLDRMAGGKDSTMPSRAELAELCGCSRPSLDRALSELVEAGWLTKKQTKYGGVNEYWLMVAPAGGGVITHEDTVNGGLLTHETPPSSPMTQPLITGDEVIPNYETGDIETTTGRASAPPAADGTLIEFPAKPPAQPKPKRAARLPDDWWPDKELQEWARAEVLTKAPSKVNLHDVTEMFRDHWKASGTPKLDWSAAYRNWVRKEIGYALARSGPSRANTGANVHVTEMDQTTRDRQRRMFEEGGRVG